MVYGIQFIHGFNQCQCMQPVNVNGIKLYIGDMC